MRCLFGHKWGDVLDRRQRCERCGIARVVECPHAWQILEKIAGEYVFFGGFAKIYIMRCKHCGDVKKEHIA